MNYPRKHMCWQSKRFYWERAPGWRAGGWGNPGEQLCQVTAVLGFMVMGLVSRMSLSSHLTQSPSWWCSLVQPRWMPERRILGGGWTCGVSFWPFRNSSCWWRLISSVFLTRISCCKTTHADDYYGAWPG